MAFNEDGDLVGRDAAHYRRTTGDLIKLYHDASEDPFGAAGAFADIRAAIRAARHFVFIVDWSFHPRVTLRRHEVIEESIGRQLLDMTTANPELLVAIMPWQHSEYLWGYMMPTGDRDNNAGPATLAAMNGGALPRNLLYQLSPYGRSGVWTHHQKFVVLDAPAVVDREPVRVVKAFFGGLDLTRGRFDWPEHPLYNPNSASFANDWYNGEFGHSLQMIREPWHDIHAQIVGASAWDFVFEFIGRWGTLSRDAEAPFRKIMRLWEIGAMLPPARMEQLPIELPDEGLTPGYRAQVLRSLDHSGWVTPPGVAELPRGPLRSALEWSPEGARYERSIQDGYLELIAAADEFIYIESQYLVSSGDDWSDTVYGKPRRTVANEVARAIVRRIRGRMEAGADFHVYIVLPMYPEGTPDATGVYEVRYLQWCTLEYMIKTVQHYCEHFFGHGPDAPDWTHYLSFFCLANWDDVFPGPDHVPQLHGRPDWSQMRLYPPEVVERRDKVSLARRYMIYVHSKMMIVDDRMAIIGSANLNERSLAGNRDSEIAVALWPDDPRRPPAAVADLRRAVWTEHLGAAWMNEVVYRGIPNGGLPPQAPETVALVDGAAQHNFVHLMRGERNPAQGHLVRWPIQLRDGQLVFDSRVTGEVPNDYIPDYPQANHRYWKWVADWTAFSEMVGTGKIPE